MKHEFLKTKVDITKWLNKYKIKHYILVPDMKYGYVVEVNSHVDLSRNILDFIPVKFSDVHGHFLCGYNQLTSLEFCPHTVAGDFYCSYNQLPTLEFCPHTIGGSFYCEGNKGLGEYQNITDFKEIYKIHKAIVDIKQEKFLLENSIITHPPLQIPGNFKI